MELKKILVPLDGSTVAEQVLPYAKTLAQKLEAELILAQIIQPEPIMPLYNGTVAYSLGYGKTVFHSELLFEQGEANLSSLYLKDVQKRLGASNLLIRTIVVEGSPKADAIVDLVRRESIDLIVMSTRGRSGISRWVYGSVAQKVLQSVLCPVFLVRANPDIEFAYPTQRFYHRSIEE